MPFRSIRTFFISTLSVSLFAFQIQDCSYQACERKFGPGQCTDYIRLQKLGSRTPTGQNGFAKCWPVDDKIVRVGSVAVLDVSGFGHVAWVEAVTTDGFTVSQWNFGPLASTDLWERCCAKTTMYRVRNMTTWKMSDSRIIGFYHPELHPASSQGTCAAAEAMQRSHTGAVPPPLSPLNPPPVQYPQSTIPAAIKLPTPFSAPASTPKPPLSSALPRHAPYLGNAVPNTRRIGTVTVELFGSDFLPGAKVHIAGANWSNEAPPVRFLDQGHLQTILVINTPGVITISVINPDGQRSGAQPLQINR
jgi:hypothetical protein